MGGLKGGYKGGEGVAMKCCKSGDFLLSIYLSGWTSCPCFRRSSEE